MFVLITGFVLLLAGAALMSVLKVYAIKGVLFLFAKLAVLLLVIAKATYQYALPHLKSLCLWLMQTTYVWLMAQLDRYRANQATKDLPRLPDLSNQLPQQMIDKTLIQSTKREHVVIEHSQQHK